MKKFILISAIIVFSFSASANDGKKKPPEDKTIIETIIEIFGGTNTKASDAKQD